VGREPTLIGRSPCSRNAPDAACRPRHALKLLKHPPTGGWAFPPEPAPKKGLLAHALERLVPTLALLAGYPVESDTERIRPDLGSHIKAD